MLGRSLEIKVFAVGKEMDLRATVDDFGQTFAAFAIQEPDDLAHALQRKSLAAELADDGDLGELVHRVEPAMAFALRAHNSAFVPPLQLARGDAVSAMTSRDVKRSCIQPQECLKQFRCKMFHTF